MTLRFDAPNPSVTAHFFDHEATNTFSVTRNGNSVTARVHGEHENANVGPESGGALKGATNAGISYGAWGLQGAHIPGTDQSVYGMQQHQWNVFTERLNGK